MKQLLERLEGSGRIDLTAEDLSRALYGKGVSYVNKGVYKGTSIPLRKVPGNAILHIDDKGKIRVTDDDGGWIADRICEGWIGRRQLDKVKAYLERRNK